MTIRPTPEQFTEFAQAERNGEVVMINLLHFTRSANEARPNSGKTAYRDYGDQVVKMIGDRGGKVIWLGRPEQVLIGNDERDDWDLAVLVSYPSRASFIDMVSSSEYERAHVDRERGLDRTVLLACEPLIEPQSEQSP